MPRRWRRLYGSGLHVRADERVTGPGLLRRGSRGGLHMRLDGVPGGQLLRRIDRRLRGLSPRDVQERDRPDALRAVPKEFLRARERRGHVLPARVRPGGWVLSTVRAERGCLCAEGRKVQRGERHDRGDARGQGTLLSFQSRVDVRLSMSGRRRRLQGLFSGTGGVW